MNYEAITELYRQIGRSFRALGAYRVILLSAKTKPEEDKLDLELAVDGVEDRCMLQEKAEAFADRAVIRIIWMEDEPERISEYEEDGILL